MDNNELEIQSFENNTTDLRNKFVTNDTLDELISLRENIDGVKDLEKLKREAKKYTETGHVAILVYIGDKPVGYVEIDDKEDPEVNIEGFDGSEYAHLSRIGVIPEARGKGVGMNLIETAEKRARDIGKQGLWLDFKEDNIPAKKIYESSGFRELATYLDRGKNRVVAIKDI